SSASVVPMKARRRPLRPSRSPDASTAGAGAWIAESAAYAGVTPSELGFFADTGAREKRSRIRIAKNTLQIVVRPGLVGVFMGVSRSRVSDCGDSVYTDG